MKQTVNCKYHLSIPILIAASILFGSCSKPPAYSAEKRTPEQLLEDLTDSRDEGVRVAAAGRLGVLKTPASVQMLILLLSDPNENIRIAAVTALGEIKNIKALEPLKTALTAEGNAAARNAMIRALGNLQDRRAAGALLEALVRFRGHPWAVSSIAEAEAALVHLGQAAIDPLIEALGNAGTRTYASEVLATLGSAAVDPLIDTLRHDENRYARLAAARALAEIQDSRAAQALDEALKTPDPELTATAYVYLIRKGQPGTEGLLMAALNGFGTLGMARDLRRCGNPILKAGAEAWFKKKQYTPPASPAQPDSLTWGNRAADRTQLALFHFDGSLASTSGSSPLQSKGVSFVNGKWESAVTVGKGGMLSYPLTGNLDFRNGTIELWVAPRLNGADAVYAKYNHGLVLFTSPKGQFFLSESAGRGFYAGSFIKGVWTGPAGGDISAWRAGEWHHVAFTYSAQEARQRLYVDGVLQLEHRGNMPMPADEGGSIMVISDPWANWVAFMIDELRISNQEKTPDEIQLDANRDIPFADNEVYRRLIGTF